MTEAGSHAARAATAPARASQAVRERVCLIDFLRELDTWRRPALLFAGGSEAAMRCDKLTAKCGTSQVLSRLDARSTKFLLAVTARKL
jgi:hypothetical protein